MTRQRGPSPIQIVITRPHIDRDWCRCRRLERPENANPNYTSILLQRQCFSRHGIMFTLLPYRLPKFRTESAPVTTDDKPISDLDENSLVEHAKVDAAAFGELYQRYVARIYNYASYRTRNHHDAEDVTARVFQRALQHIPSYIDRGIPFSAWLYRIAHNLV